MSHIQDSKSQEGKLQQLSAFSILDVLYLDLNLRKKMKKNYIL